MMLEVCYDGGLWTLSFGLSQSHGHGSWLMCEVALIIMPTSQFMSQELRVCRMATSCGGPTWDALAGPDLACVRGRPPVGPTCARAKGEGPTEPPNAGERERKRRGRWVPSFAWLPIRVGPRI